tara:strand:- start:279 stop:473 length:195 start_codon:yes stop_codon:yes gene_type:complete
MRTSFERLAIGMTVRTNKGLGFIIGVSELTNREVEIDVQDIDSEEEEFYMLDEVEILDSSYSAI